MGIRILFVDDERRWTSTYVEELEESGYAVKLETDVDHALQFLEGNRGDIDLLILDLMMPHGSSFTDEETEMGLRTGVLFYKKVRQQQPELHVIILTNFSDKEVESWFNQQEHCMFLEKPETLPYELSESVRTVMGM